MEKKYSAIVSALIGLIFLTGCGNEHAQKSAIAETKPTLAVIPKGTTHVYWQSLKSGAEAAGSALEVDADSDVDADAGATAEAGTAATGPPNAAAASVMEAVPLMSTLEAPTEMV
jgi:ABC-type sugar transport system substrate-binding protein